MGRTKYRELDITRTKMELKEEDAHWNSVSQNRVQCEAVMTNTDMNLKSPLKSGYFSTNTTTSYFSHVLATNQRTWHFESAVLDNRLALKDEQLSARGRKLTTKEVIIITIPWVFLQASPFAYYLLQYQNPRDYKVICANAEHQHTIRACYIVLTVRSKTNHQHLC